MNALAFAKTGACPPQEKAWANSIKELKAEAKEALAAAGGGTSADGAGAEEGGRKVPKKKSRQRNLRKLLRKKDPLKKVKLLKGF